MFLLSVCNELWFYILQFVICYKIIDKNGIKILVGYDKL